MDTEKSNEISIKELVFRIREWINYLLTQLKIIIPVVLIGMLLGLIYALNGKKIYVARLTFALEEKSGGLGSYASLASQFGIDLGGGSSGAFTGDNLLEVMKSRLIIEKTLLTPVTIDNRTDLLINRYIEFSKLQEQWSENESLKDLKFQVGVPRKKYSIKQDSILNVIQSRIEKQSIVINRFDKRLNLVSIECKSEDEYFAKYFTEILVENASSFYIETKTKKSRSNVAILEHKVDSIKNLLDNLLYSSATSQDKNINLIKARNKVPYLQEQIDIQLLTAAYIELTKNHELASFSLLREEPLVQVIDTPILPLRYEKRSKLTSMLLFGILSGTFIVSFLSIKRIIRNGFKE